MRPLRNSDPEIYRKIVIKTREGRLWFSVSRNVTKIVGGIFARYQEMFGITIYAITVLGNHYHLLCRAPKGNIDEFEENVNRELAKRLNYRHDRSGPLWARRYDDLAVQTDEDLLEAFLYVTTNMVKHGLVSKTREWTGLNSYKQLLSGRSSKFSFYHYSGVGRVTSHRLRLTPLPQFEHLTQGKRRKVLIRLIAEREEQIVVERRERGEGFLGLESLKEQELGAKPRSSSKSPRPPCYSKYAQKIREFRERERLRRQRYREASVAFRMGEIDVEFPLYTFKPPTHRKPRVSPFGEYLVSQFLNIN